MSKRRRHAAGKSSPPEALRPTETLRVIGGNLRHSRLHYTGDARTRPMKDRLREAVFSRLGPRVKGSIAIDLFAGTGALGIEAVSRGASQAIFVEQHRPTAHRIQENADRLGIADKCRILPGSAFYWVRSLGLEGSTPWMVFCSPPWKLFSDQREEMCNLIAHVMATAPAGSWLTVEADEQFDFAQVPGATAWDIRNYPPAVIGFYECGADGAHGAEAAE